MPPRLHAIRPAVPSDADALLELLRELGYRDLDADAYARAFASVTGHPEMRVLVAEGERGQLVGMLSLSHRPQLRLGGMLVTIDELAVTADARGLGIGRELLARAKELANELCAVRLELHTNRARESYDRGFYAKNGFIEVNSAVMRMRQ